MLYLKNKTIVALAALVLLAPLSSASAEEKLPQPKVARVVVVTEPFEVPSFIFTRNLTVGDEGADVVGLQMFLERKGFIVMPSGTARGYFGPITRAGLAAWQRASGIHPSLGYFGPISRAKMNADILDF